jgi:hypothetical protein
MAKRRKPSRVESIVENAWMRLLNRFVGPIILAAMGAIGTFLYNGIEDAKINGVKLTSTLGHVVTNLEKLSDNNQVQWQKIGELSYEVKELGKKK